jgi:hypothetical protein
MKILDRCKATLIVLMMLTADLLPVAVKSQTTAPVRPLVIQGGTLIDATGRPPLQDVVIVIEGERIKAVGKRGDVAIPKGSRIIDVKGKTILPGLIDGHCHLLDFVGELYLHLGITTCPDITQNDDDWTMAQRDGTNLGKIRGPRIWSTGTRLVGPPPAWARRAESGHLVKSVEEARAVVRRKKEMGLDIVKFNEYVEPEVIKAGAEEANRLGLPVTCHCLDVFLAAEAGFAGVEHHWVPGMTSISDADHKRLNIYAGGGADYAMAVGFLKTRREEAKNFLSGICEGITVARQNKPKALEIMTKSERGRDPAALEYLYRLYTAEVIPARPHPKVEGIELGIQMVASTVPAAGGMKAHELVDATLIEEMVKEGRCN